MIDDVLPGLEAPLDARGDALLLVEGGNGDKQPAWPGFL
jgi:hypothetical protein